MPTIRRADLKPKNPWQANTDWSAFPHPEEPEWAPETVPDALENLGRAIVRLAEALRKEQ